MKDQQFDKYQFNPSYYCDICPEYTNNGSDKILLFKYSDNVLTGSGLCVYIEQANGDSWIGQFEWGDHSFTKKCACPNPNHLFVIANGASYLVDAITTTPIVINPIYPVLQCMQPVGFNKLLIASYTHMCSIGIGGIEWISEEIASDELRIEYNVGNSCYVRVWDAIENKYMSKNINLQNGEINLTDHI